MRQEGFTLFEVIAAVAILGITLVAVLEMFALGTQLTASRGEELVANNLLSGKVEWLKNKGLLYIVDEPAAVCADCPTETCVLKNCNMKVDGEDYLPFSNTSLKKITVSVMWDSADGTSQQRDLIALVGNH